MGSHVRPKGLDVRLINLTESRRRMLLRSKRLPISCIGNSTLAQLEPGPYIVRNLKGRSCHLTCNIFSFLRGNFTICLAVGDRDMYLFYLGLYEWYALL